MTIELLNKLERKIGHAIETIELLKLQIDELEEENAALRAEQEKWRHNISDLLSRFDGLEGPIVRTLPLEEETLV